MKNILFATLLLTVTSAFAETEIVPLDVDPGYWESNTELVFNKEIDDMLANLPESQRTLMKEMMKSKAVVPTVKTCITDESYTDFEKDFKESMDNAEGCEMTLKESTGESFIGEYQCDDFNATFSIEVVNSKRHVTEVITTAGGAVQTKVNVIAEWKGADCPADAAR